MLEEEKTGEERKENDIRKKLMDSLLEGKRMEAYAEHRTEDMNHCHLCERIAYKKLAGKQIGEKWMCIDCLKKFKEILDTLDEWEEEVAMGEEMKNQLDDNLGL